MFQCCPLLRIMQKHCDENITALWQNIKMIILKIVTVGFQFTHNQTLFFRTLLIYFMDMLLSHAVRQKYGAKCFKTPKDRVLLYTVLLNHLIPFSFICFFVHFSLHSVQEMEKDKAYCINIDQMKIEIDTIPIKYK